MKDFQKHELQAENLKLANVYLGMHTKLTAPEETVVMAFEFSPEKKLTPKLALAMVYSLQVRIGLPAAAVKVKLSKLSQEELLAVFKRNFSRYRELTILASDPEEAVELAGPPTLSSPEHLARADLHIYRS